MLTKEKVLNAIKKLPDEFSIDQAIDELILLEKIDNGLAQSKVNDVIPDEKLDKELPEWTTQSKNDLISIAEFIAQDYPCSKISP